MADILHDLSISTSIEKVFEAISTPNGLDQWWTKTSTGKLRLGETFQLHFEPNYYWTAVVTKCIIHKEFELTLLIADNDWKASKVGFHLTENQGVTKLQFYHTGWKEVNEHFRISNYCWALYLRLLKRYLERNESVAYANRLHV